MISFDEEPGKNIFDLHHKLEIATNELRKIKIDASLYGATSRTIMHHLHTEFPKKEENLYLGSDFLTSLY